MSDQDPFDGAADDAQEGVDPAADGAAETVSDGATPPPPPPPTATGGGTNPWPWIIGILAVAVIALLVWNPFADDTGDTTTTTAAADTTTTAAADTTTTAAETTTTAAAETTTTATPDDFYACQVTDVGGVDDRSFNQTAFAGLQRAESELGARITVLESQSEVDYETNLNSLIAEGCDIIVTVGFLLGDATDAAAAANPDVPFSIVDVDYLDRPNILGQAFNTQEAAFLAGYLAAATTQTGTVGTFGGINIPPVTVFMDGFVQGVDYHNEQKNTSVTVLGWDYLTRSGLFTGNFNSLDDGRSFAQDLLDNGADIVLPVAGPVGLGSAALAIEVGTDQLKIIGVDADQTQTDPTNAAVYLTSILKNMDVTTFEAIEAVFNGTFQGGLVTGDLENGGVGLAGFGSFEAEVSAETRAELEAIRAQIIAGDIVVRIGGA